MKHKTARREVLHAIAEFDQACLEFYEAVGKTASSTSDPQGASSVFGSAAQARQARITDRQWRSGPRCRGPQVASPASGRGQGNLRPAGAGPRACVEINHSGVLIEGTKVVPRQVGMKNIK